MSVRQQRLLNILHYQRYLALTDIDYSTSLDQYIINGNWRLSSIQLGLLALMIWTFYCILVEQCIYFVDMNSSTANSFYHLLVLATPIVQLLIHCCCRLQQQLQLHLIQTLADFAQRLQVNTLELAAPCWLCRLWFVTSVLYALHITTFGLFYWYVDRKLAHLLSLIVFYVHMVRSNYLITCYSSLVLLINNLLQAVAEKLQTSSQMSLEQFASYLLLFDELHLVCQQLLLQVYGGVLLLIYPYLALDTTCILYISAMNERYSVLKVPLVLSWLVPLLLYLCLPLIINNLDKQFRLAMVENQRSELYPFYWICRYLGIFCVDFNTKLKRLEFRYNLLSYSVHLLMQSYLLGCMVVLILFWSMGFVSEMTTTGNHFERLVLFAACISQFLQSLWTLGLQRTQVHIVRQLECYRRKYLSARRLRLPLRLFWLILFATAVYLVNYMRSGLIGWWYNRSIWFLLSTLGFPLRVLITSFMLGLYICLIHVVRSVLRSNQAQLEALAWELQQRKRLCNVVVKLRNCLDIHDRLFALCSDEFSLIYGFNIWLCLLFSSLDATSIIYIVTVSETNETLLAHIAMTAIWLSPTMLITATGFISSTVQTQCLGLLCLTHNAELAASKANELQALLSLLLMQIVAGSAFAYATFNPQLFELPIYTRVGNIFMLFNFHLACLFISLIYLCFYIKRRSLAALLALLLEHNRLDLNNRFARSFVIRFAIYVGLFTLCGITHVKALTHAQLAPLPCALLIVMFTYSYLLIGLIVVLYSCLAQLLAALLHLYNRDLLAAAAISASHCRLRLKQRNRLIHICHHQVNSHFGLLMIPLVIYMVSTAPGGPFYFITIVLELKVSREGLQNFAHAFVTSLMWNIPWLYSLVLALGNDFVTHEVSSVNVAMSVCHELRLYLRLLNLAGMLCCQFEAESCLLQCTKSSERYALVYASCVLLLTLSGFGFAQLQTQLLYMSIQSETGNYYETVNFRSFCLVLALLYGCLYGRRRRHLRLVQQLLQLNRLCYSPSSERCFRRYFVIYQSLLLLCVFNYVNGAIQAYMFDPAVLLFITVYSYGFFVIGLLLIFFVCLQRIVVAGLAHHNELLQQAVCRRVLLQRQQLLTLCAGELNDCFGDAADCSS
ncbi:Gr39a, partial [Drosophila busckii]